MKPFIFSCALFASLQASAAPARVLLTFDDGPNEQTTNAVLEELEKRKAKAVFFILTGPETLFKRRSLRRVYPKAETESGFRTVMKVIARGHLIACHWGGTYRSQSNYHPPRLLEPAYDSTGDGVVDKISETGNALESDLIQCRERLNQALFTAQSEVAGQDIQKPGTISYVRPPVWKYKIDDLDARPVYEALGMQMVMTDFRLVDGGYPHQGFPMPGRMAARTAKAISEGQTDVVLTMHDSNAQTAKDLPKILDKLEHALKRRGLVQGVDWEYTENIEEIQDVLRNFLERTAHQN
jgi:peptidoglycan/xylan/chitin deacetylase (PgdA/CDA1 family)